MHMRSENGYNLRKNDPVPQSLDRWTDHTSHEIIKALVHAGLLGLAGVCLLYNSSAWQRRRERHLFVNSVIYGALVGLEVYQITRHVRGYGSTTLAL